MKVVTPQLQKIDISSGLSENIVTCMLSDKKGFLWAGTLDGLNRFDGTNMDIFRKEFALNNRYVNNLFYHLWETPNGKIIAYKQSGNYILDPSSDSILLPQSFVDYDPVFFGNSTDKEILATTRSQDVVKISLEDYQITPLSYNSDIDRRDSTSRFIGFISSSENNYRLIYNNGDILEYLNGSYQLHEMPFDLPSKTISSYTITHDSLVWIGSRNGDLYTFNTNSKKYSRYSTNFGIEGDFIINHLYYDSKFDALWVCTYRKGLFKFDFTFGDWTKYIIRTANSKIPDSENVTSIHRDSRDVLWIGTDHHGILVWDPYLLKFESLKPHIPEHANIDFRMPRKIIGDRYGNLWIGSNNTGLWRYNPKTSKLDVFTKDNNPDLMVANSAIQLFADEDTLWVGHNGKGVSKILISKLKLLENFTLKSQDDRILNHNVIWNISKDQLGRLWLGTRESGIFIKNGRGFKEINSYNSNLPNNTIFAIFPADTMRMLICPQFGGIYQYNINDQSLTQLFPKDTSKVLYATKALNKTSTGYYWYGTDGKGILLLDGNFNILAKASTENGLLQNDGICSILIDENDNAWVSTNFGLYQLHYNPDTKSIQSRMYTEMDGLTSNEFMTGAYHKSGATLWMGNMEGINYFDPVTIQDNPYPHEVYLRDIQLNNESIDRFDVLGTLSHRENDISFEYSTIGFTIPKKIKFSYRLIGYDTSWTQASDRNFVSYTNLRPANYSFQLKSCNYDNKWNDKILIQNFKIRKAFWQHWLFQFLIIALLLTIAYILYKSRIRKIKNQENIKNKHIKELSEMEMKALRAQINPHFLFNTLNSINNYILQKDDKAASHYLVKFSKLMRNILSNSANSFISLSDELKALDLYIEIESMRFGNAFDYFINTDAAIQLDDVQIPPMLLQPFVENAIWHGLMHKDGEKCLEIDIQKASENSIRISIKDNGIGREKTAQMKIGGDKRKSFGMEITRKRIKLINNEIGGSDNKSRIDIEDLFEDGKAAGTCVHLIIPLITTDQLRHET